VGSGGCWTTRVVLGVEVVDEVVESNELFEVERSNVEEGARLAIKTEGFKRLLVKVVNMF
jgi:hypothetical protein